MDAFMGLIMPVGFTFAPRGWAFCNGQLMSIAQNSALFALLGTTYGGDGQNTFGLPDMRGRVPVGSQAQGPGLTNVVQGQLGGSNSVTVLATGSATVTLSAGNLPAHTHGATGLIATTTVNVSTGTGGSLTPTAGSVLTGTSPGTPAAAAVYLPAATTPTAPVALGGVTTALSGNTASAGNGTALNAPVSTTSTAASIMQPYLGVNFIICMEGIFPSRN
jgi:microcystin-dependent protein